MKFQYSGKAAAAMMLAFVMLAGCKSKEDAAIDKAKQQAAATGQAQQVVSTDKNGNVTTTTVQPPAPGQTAQAVTTTVTPAAGVAANTPATAPVATGQPVTAGQTDASGQPVQAPAPGGDADCSACGCEYCCGNESDDSDQSAHQREDAATRATGLMARLSIRWWETTIAW